MIDSLSLAFNPIFTMQKPDAFFPFVAKCIVFLVALALISFAIQFGDVPEYSKGPGDHAKVFFMILFSLVVGICTLAAWITISSDYNKQKREYEEIKMQERAGEILCVFGDRYHNARSAHTEYNERTRYGKGYRDNSVLEYLQRLAIEKNNARSNYDHALKLHRTNQFKALEALAVSHKIIDNGGADR